MDNLINPYDLGDFQIAELSDQVCINDLIRKANNALKMKLLNAQIDLLGIRIGLTTSKTRFNGERLWFVCPKCNHRVGIVYNHPIDKIIACRKCLGLIYKAQKV